MEDKLGVVHAGAFADLLILDKDPTENICNFDSVYMVLRDGKPVTDHRA